MALFAVTSFVSAQRDKVEYKLSRFHREVVENNGNFVEEANPYLLTRVNGGDWRKVSDDRIVIQFDKANLGWVYITNYMDYSMTLVVKYTKELLHKDDKTGEWKVTHKNKLSFTTDITEATPSGPASKSEGLFWINSGYVKVRIHIDEVKASNVRPSRYKK